MTAIRGPQGVCRLFLLACCAVVACKQSPPSPQGMDGAVVSASSTSSSLPALPPEPAPPLAGRDGGALATMTELVRRRPELEDIWLGGPRLNALLTAISESLETLRADGRTDVSPVLQSRLRALRLDDVAHVFEEHIAINGELPADFTTPLEAHLVRMRPSVRLGVWRAPSGPDDASWFDFSALAAWLHRDDPAYLREHIAARGPGGARVWGSAAAAVHRWLASEGAALARLALQLERRQATLTSSERARLDLVGGAPLAPADR